MEYRCAAIVLKKKEIGETDRLYTLYTREQGKMKVVARGIRKPEAKLASQLENGTFADVAIARTRGTGKITGAVAEETFPFLRNDLEILKRILESLHIFERLVDAEEPDAELFDLLKAYLALSHDLAREGKLDKIFLLSEGFLFKLFAHLGYAIETGTCVVSGAKLKAGDRHFFSPGQGGILSGEHSALARGSFPVSENTIKLIRVFLTHPLERCFLVSVDTKELREARSVTTSFARWILG